MAAPSASTAPSVWLRDVSMATRYAAVVTD